MRHLFRTSIRVNAENKVMRDKEKPAHLMCRKEFFELFLRLAQLEYPSLKLREAFPYYLDNHILPHTDFSCLQRYRETELWTKGVNNMFVSNISEIQRVLRLPQYSKPLTFENLERIFMLDIRPRLVKDR